MASRSKKKHIKRQAEPMRAIDESIEEYFPNVFKKGGRNTPRKVKMSKVLEKFVEPCVQYDMTDQEYTTLVGIGVMAWNLALLPPNERRDEFERILSTNLIPMDDNGRLIIDYLVHRKEALFSSIRKPIISYDVSPQKQGRLLTVASLHDDFPTM